ncbi:act minimal PKS chain-length factor (CLF/KS beta) [Catenulispora sp. GAS73]|uniref:ketosynthase chain-length factor n=1 Tax=Catenulispora sp. GAS73 TaxID=3156269 RepID=UPI003516EED3
MNVLTPARLAGPAASGADGAVGPAGVAPVVTGIGVVAPTGATTEEYWAATRAGVSGLRRIDRFDADRYPVRAAGLVAGFDVKSRVPGRLVPATDRWTQLALGAAQAALDDAGVDPAEQDPFEMSVVTASSSGGNEFGQREIARLWSSGPEYVSAYQSIAWFYAATTGQLGIRHGMKGPCGVVVSEQASGLDAIGQARREMRLGVRIAVTGGTEAPIGPYALTCQIASGLLSGTGSYRPFDTRADGYLPGEGGAILVLEHPDRAPDGGYGVVAGYAAGFDPAPGSGRPPALRRTIEAALADAGLRPDEVDVVFADGAGIAERDRAEARALEAVFGAGGVPVTVPKTTTGRLYAGGASLDVATALLALRDQTIPPTMGVRPDPELHLDLVCAAERPATLRTALVLARGHDGFTSALVLRRTAGRTPGQTPGQTPGRNRKEHDDA